MYHIRTLTFGTEMILAAMTSAPLGPAFSSKELDGADSMEVWGSSIKDPGSDYVEFRLYQGKMPGAIKRVEGY